MNFWKWYLKGLLQIPRSIISPWAEYMWGILLGVATAMVFAITLILFPESSPWVLLTLLALPIGITLACHGYWRAVVNKQ